MLLLALLLIVVFFAVADRMRGGAGFSTIRNVRVVLAQTSTIAVAALGMTLIIIAGGIDLSAGTALALCATVMAVALKSEYSVPMVLLLTVGCGCLCGMVNGLLISLLRVVPFIVTLGTLTIYLGAGKIIADESTVFPPRDAIPYWLQNLCTTRPPDTGFGFCANGLGFGIIISWGVVFAFFLALLVLAILRYTVFGRYVFALGSNEATARLCGVPIVRTKIAVYTLAGLFVGLAGMYHFSVLKIGNPTDGPGMELDIIAAVVIGGGSLSGGRGSVLGTLTGAAVMAVIRSGCDQLEVPGPYQDVIIGAIIIVAVALDQLRQRRLAT
jgi:ribose/xylose/arabinose/galactoside ABC-type transport system permease subunit